MTTSVLLDAGQGRLDREHHTYFATTDEYAQGYKLSEQVMWMLVDEGVETVIIVTPTRRLVADCDTWQDYSRDDGLGHYLLPVAYMEQR